MSFQVHQSPSTKKTRLRYTTDEDVSINREMEFQDEDEFLNEQPLTPETFTNDFSGDSFLAHQFCSHNTFANKFRVHTTQN